MLIAKTGKPWRVQVAERLSIADLEAVLEIKRQKIPAAKPPQARKTADCDRPSKPAGLPSVIPAPPAPRAGATDMGEVYATMGIWASDRSYLRNLRMKADTGAAYSQLPAELLHEMGWSPTQPPRPARLADGTATTVALGEVKMRYNGEDLTSLFVFGEDDCIPLLGCHTLQGYGLGVDTVNHRLIPIEAHR